MTAPGESFRHEALLHHGDDGFLASAVPFIRDGLATGERIIVAVGPTKLARLRERLDDPDDVHFADMRELGRNPGRLISAWHEFLDGDGARGVRGIAEPIWPGRKPAELTECHRHEALLNLAFANVVGFRVLCPYDLDALDPETIHEARRSHPTIRNARGEPQTSTDYDEGTRLPARLDAPLPQLAAPAQSFEFGRHGLPDVRRIVAHAAEATGLPAHAIDDLVLAAHEIAANSVRHGGGKGTLTVWREDHTLLCEIRDRGQIRDPLAGRRKPTPGHAGGWGIWIANHVCDLVQIRSHADGTTVRLHMAAHHARP